MLKKAKFVIWCVAISACSSSRGIIPLTYNHSNKLRLDGFYYSSYSIGMDKYIHPFYLYKNGVLFSKSSFQFKNEAMKEKILDSFATMQQPISTFAYKMQGFWGVYEINGDTIKLKKQQHGPGNIIVETTGLITSAESFSIIAAADKSLRKEEYEAVCKFKQSLTKPDSTNNFFK
jgi:hypothetical protein